MAKRAELADGRVLEFPDNTSDAVVERVVRQMSGGGGVASADTGAEDQPVSRLHELTYSGVGKGISGLAGMPMDVANAARGAGDYLRRKMFEVAGAPMEKIAPPAEPLPGGSPDIQAALESNVAPFTKPEGIGEAAYMGALQGAVSAVPFGGPAARLAAASQAASETAGTVTEGKPIEPYARFAAGMGVPAAKVAASRFVKSLPGAAGGLQEANFVRTGQRGENLARRFSPEPGTANRLFGETRQAAQGVMVQPNAVKQALVDLSEEAGSEFGKMTRMGPIMRAANRISGKSDISFQQFRLEQSSLGKLIRNMEETKGAALGAAKKIYSALWDDMDEALRTAPGPAAEKLQEAISAFKQEEAARMFKKMFDTSTSRRVGMRQLNADSLMQKLDKNRDVMTRLIGEEGYDDLLKTIEPLAKTPMSDKAAQYGFSWMPSGSRLAGALMGAGAANAAGFGAAGAAFGGMGGLAAGAVISEGLSALLATPTGRAFVRDLATKGTPLPQIVNAAMQSGQFNLNTREQ